MFNNVFIALYKITYEQPLAKSIRKIRQVYGSGPRGNSMSTDYRCADKPGYRFMACRYYRVCRSENLTNYPGRGRANSTATNNFKISTSSFDEIQLDGVTII